MENQARRSNDGMDARGHLLRERSEAAGPAFCRTGRRLLGIDTSATGAASTLLAPERLHGIHPCSSHRWHGRRNDADREGHADHDHEGAGVHRFDLVE